MDAKTRRIILKMENKMLIYQARNLINGNCYIGQTIHNLHNRKQNHLTYAKSDKNNTYFYNAINQYGKENFKWIILEENISHINQLNWLEKFYIGYLETLCPNGYNSTTGGHNSIPSDYTRKKRSKTLMGHKHSDKTKKKIGKKSEGRFCSKETREKMSKAHKDKKHSKLHCLHLSISGKGRKFSKKHCKKLSEAASKRTGNKNASAKSCLINGIQYETITDAAKKIKKSKYLIRKLLQESSKSICRLHMDAKTEKNSRHKP